ncbi:response regulator [Photobacterium sanguinicancri]|uniref:response regulator n=1 Tax=Photobacterium sanguinicancri TaxID=875932 RepID=UPI0026E45084|nr:response regulator [Photobacterium sanguinicancri]MDO6500079.1 response regulator [Photobacterium sanguinicancri]
MRQDSSVLVVDDCSIIQQTTKLILQNCGFNPANIHTATNAIDAIKICQNKMFDILFIDFNLGHGSTGLQLLEHLSQKKLLAHSPMVFVITAEDSTPVFMGFAEFEPDDYLIKPLRTDALQQRLQTSFTQRKLNDLVQTQFKLSGVGGAKSALQQAKSTKAFRQAITALCKQLTLDGEHQKATALLASFVPKHPYLPAQLLLVELYLLQQDIVSANAVLTAVRLSHPNHLLVLDLSAKIALQNHQLTDAMQYWQHAQQLSNTNLERQFSIFWLAQVNNTQSAFSKLREACMHIQYSIWDMPRYHALLFVSQIEQEIVQKHTIERQWLMQTSQKALSAEDRAFVSALKALQAVKKGDHFKAYRYLQHNYISAADELRENNFEFNAILQKVYRHLSMTKSEVSVLAKLDKLSDEETNASHRLLKKFWLKSQRSSLNTATQAYQQALTLFNEKQYKQAGQALLNIWPNFRFDNVIARQLIELFSMNLLPLTHQQREYLMEARWTFEALPEPPVWYQTLRTQDDAFATPIEQMTAKASGSATPC